MEACCYNIIFNVQNSAHLQTKSIGTLYQGYANTKGMLSTLIDIFFQNSVNLFKNPPTYYGEIEDIFPLCNTISYYNLEIK